MKVKEKGVSGCAGRLKAALSWKSTEGRPPPQEISAVIKRQQGPKRRKLHFLSKFR